MALEQILYIAPRPEYRKEFRATATWDLETKEFVHPEMYPPREIARWNNHSNLHQWMIALYLEKGGKGDFHDEELELTWVDVDRLHKDILAGKIRNNWRSGLAFGLNFGSFGSPQDDKYSEYDVECCINAKAEIFLGLRIFYNSTW
jgi:hypothetical protein